MILATTGLILGALIGGFLAYRRKGNKLDILQYAGAYGMMLGVCGMILAIIIVRLG